MVKNCLNCGKQFDGVERKFCSWQCDENYKKTPGTKPNDAVKDDKVGAHNFTKDAKAKPTGSKTRIS